MKPANEKVAPTQHDYVPHAPAADPLAKTGYVEKAYEHQEYPKVVGGVTVKDADEEAAVLAKSAPAPAAPAPDEDDMDEIKA